MHIKIVPNPLYRDFEVTGTLHKASEHRIVSRTVLKKHEKFLLDSRIHNVQFKRGLDLP